MTRRSAIVVGGGLAGITTALDLADAGAAVTLLEVRPRLGGAAYSFERDELEVDNGQHVFLRCCDRVPGAAAAGLEWRTARCSRSAWRSRCWRPTGSAARSAAAASGRRCI